jgi:hypothetical protein
MERYIALLAFSLLAGCRSNPHQTADNLHWVYGRALPLVAPIKQTNFEIDFFESVGLTIERGFREQLRGEGNVSIEPIAMWTVFTYPANTGLAIETEVHEDVTEMTGWVLAPDGSLRESNNTNKTQLVLVRQKYNGVSEATARLTMLLQVQSDDSTNFTTAVLPCVWHGGTLENQGLKLKGYGDHR